MPRELPRVLFIPVSSPEGIGEYMRSLILARAIAAEWPDASIRFILNRHAPYTSSCPYPVLQLDASPTRCESQVCKDIEAFLPDLVIFDASGRQSQLARAKAVGARVIFISQHKSKRRRGMRLSRAKYTDYHWIVQPEFVIGPPAWLNSLKLKIFGFASPRCIGPVFTNPEPGYQQALQKQYSLQPANYVLLNAGSGGHKTKYGLAADIFARAATDMASRGVRVVMVFGPNYPAPIPDLPGVLCLREVANGDFINLLAGCRYAVLSGGDTLLQAIALGIPTLAVAVSKDQPKRIGACLRRNLILTSQCQADAIIQQARTLDNPHNASKLKQNMATVPELNGLALAMRDIQQLLE